MLTARERVRIAQIAVESDVPGCWTCTLWRISLRLQARIGCFALAAGLIWGVIIGMMLRGLL